MKSVIKFAVLMAALVMVLAPKLMADDPPPTDTFVGLWSASMTPDDTASHAGQQAFNTKLDFANGQLTPELFSMLLGFSPADYTVSVDSNGKTVFKCTLQSDTKGTVVWNGSVGSDTLTGTIDWSKSDGNTYHYTFSCTKVTGG
jgi:hypothetical protein